VLEYAEAMTRTPVDVPDELFASLRRHLDERQIEAIHDIAAQVLRSFCAWLAPRKIWL